MSLMRGHDASEPQAPDSHFFMKLDFAAPASFLPSLPTAFASQEDFMHFFMKLVLAAPASALPSLPTALVSQDASCARAGVMAGASANIETTAAISMRFMVCSS